MEGGRQLRRQQRNAPPRCTRRAAGARGGSGFAVRSALTWPRPPRRATRGGGSVLRDGRLSSRLAGRARRASGSPRRWTASRGPLTQRRPRTQAGPRSRRAGSPWRPRRWSRRGPRAAPRRASTRRLISDHRHPEHDQQAGEAPPAADREGGDEERRDRDREHRHAMGGAGRALVRLRGGRHGLHSGVGGSADLDRAIVAELRGAQGDGGGERDHGEAARRGDHALAEAQRRAQRAATRSSGGSTPSPPRLEHDLTRPSAARSHVARPPRARSLIRAA